MRFIFLIIIFNLITNCSLNTNSKYWTEDDLENKDKFKNEMNKVLLKSNDITQMTWEEYKLYLRDYTIKTNYPDL